MFFTKRAKVIGVLIIAAAIAFIVMGIMGL